MFEGFRYWARTGGVAASLLIGALPAVAQTFPAPTDEAANVPLLVDADHGYGNALNARRACFELQRAGACLITIEDTDLPPAGRRPQLVTLEEGAGKIRAALEARSDPDLVVAARTSAVAIAGVDEAIRRVRVYEQLGVDAIFLSGLKTRAELDAVSEATHVPLMLGGAGPELTGDAYLESRRVRIALPGHDAVLGAYTRSYEIMRALRDGTSQTEISRMVDMKLMRVLMNEGDYDEPRDRFLTAS